jgi:hypothetical protein
MWSRGVLEKMRKVTILWGKRSTRCLGWGLVAKVRHQIRCQINATEKYHTLSQVSFHYNISFKNTLALIMLRLRLMSYKIGCNTFNAFDANPHAQPIQRLALQQW